MEREIRRGIELRAADEDGRPVIEGTAIVFGQRSADMGFREIIAPGSVELDEDLVLNFDHQSQYILGRTSNNTLQVTTDDTGVHFKAYPPDTQWVRDLIVSLRDKFISQCSFEFICRDSQWENTGAEVVRTVTDALVYALSVVAQPAYPQTSAEARDKAAALASAPDDQLGVAEARDESGDTAEKVGASEPGSGDEAPGVSSTTPRTVFVPGVGFVTQSEGSV